MRRRRKRDIVIELTALLDVIMIMIFMVMNENSKLIKEQQGMLDAAQQVNMEQAGEIDDLTAQLAEALGKLEEGNLDGYQAMDEVAVVISVNLENLYNNSIRRLTYSSTADPDHTSKIVTAHNDEEFSSAVNELKVFLSDYTKQVPDGDPAMPAVYVVFACDPGKVYQRDFKAVDEAIAARIDSAHYHPRLISP